MEPASKILIVGGMANLLYSSAVGFKLAQIRTKGPIADTFLPLAHRVSLWWGFMFLGLAWAVTLSPLSTGLETSAAWLLIGSSVLSDMDPVINFLQGARDPVAERRFTIYLGGLSFVLVTGGLVILSVGVIQGI
jgi:hypothetical protein